MNIQQQQVQVSEKFLNIHNPKLLGTTITMGTYAGKIERKNSQNYQLMVHGTGQVPGSA